MLFNNIGVTAWVQPCGMEVNILAWLIIEAQLSHNLSIGDIRVRKSHEF